MAANIRDGIPIRRKGMPKKWEEIGELVLSNQDRQEDCIIYLTQEQVNLKIKMASSKIVNILYGVLSVILGTVISILMQRYL